MRGTLATLALTGTVLSGCSLEVGCSGRGFHAGPGAEEAVTLEVPVGAATALSVESSAGDVAAGPATKEGFVVVRAVKRAPTQADLARVKVTAAAEGNEVRVGYAVDGDRDGVSVDFSVDAPADLRPRLVSGAGDVRASGFRNGAEARSSAGDVEVRGVLGEVVARTSAGDVEVEGADGTVSAETSAGDVRVSGRLRGACRARSGAGDVRVVVPGDCAIRFEGSTSAGDARSDFGGAREGLAGGSLSGSVGDGSGGKVEITSSAGDVELRKAP
jgi:hypothetical protein